MALGNRGKRHIELSFEEVGRRSISETVTATGKIYPELEVKISSEISGDIVELYVQDGDSVQAGQLLLEIDPEIVRSDVERTRASLNGSKAQLSSAKASSIRAQASLTNAEAQYLRTKTLFDQGVNSQADLDVAQANYAAAQADYDVARENVAAAGYTVQSTEQTLKQMLENLNNTSIRAPVDGIISGLSVKRGETVLGTSMMSGTELMRVIDLSKLSVKIEVSESDVLRIAHGDSAWIEVDAYPDKLIRGKVVHISTAAKSALGTLSNDQAANFEVEIDLDEAHMVKLIGEEGRSRYLLFPGMSATAEIKTRQAESVLTVPIQSVGAREDSSGGQRRMREVVFVANDDLVRQVHVETGIQDDDYIEVRTGLEEGWEVVSGPYSAISRELEDSVQFRRKE